MQENKVAAERMEGELLKMLTSVPEPSNPQPSADGDVAMTPAPPLDGATAPATAGAEGAELDRLKAKLSAVDERKSYLNSRIAAFEQQQATREQKLRELIAKATGFPPENMDESMLRALLEELQAD